MVSSGATQRVAESPVEINLSVSRVYKMKIGRKALKLPAKSMVIKSKVALSCRSLS